MSNKERSSYKLITTVDSPQRFYKSYLGVSTFKHYFEGENALDRALDFQNNITDKFIIRKTGEILATLIK